MNISEMRKNEPLQFDDMVAEQVCGWVFSKKNNTSNGCWLLDEKFAYANCFVPHVSTQDDYYVLCHVREKWKAQQKLSFRENLHRIWNLRADSEHGFLGCIHYLPGDYAEAALKVVMIE